MNEVNNGGPAFPVPGEETRMFDYGMSLRDWFAGQAMAGFSSTLSGVEHIHWSKLASDAYTAADAMLAARKGGDA